LGIHSAWISIWEAFSARYRKRMAKISVTLSHNYHWVLSVIFYVDNSRYWDHCFQICSRWNLCLFLYWVNTV
jgi:hypothetical protein